MKKEHYTTVFSQTLSADGDRLAAGDCFGNIALYSMKKVRELGCGGVDDAGGDVARELMRPDLRFAAGESAVYSMASDERHLLVCCGEELRGYRWRQLSAGETTLAWSFPVLSGDSPQLLEPSCVAETSGRVFLALGRHVVVYDLETRQRLQVLQGHTDGVLAVCVTAEGCSSAGEDGTVRLWDTRSSGAEIGRLEPHKNPQLARADRGRWLGALDVTDDWIVCGGGPQLGLFHRRSSALATVCPLPSVAHVARFQQDGFLVAGGDAAELRLFNMSSGEVHSVVHTSCSAVFSVVAVHQPKPLLIAAGCGKLIDVCSSNQYKDFSISFV